MCHQASNTAPISIVYVYQHAPSINTQNTKLSPSNGIPTHYKKQQRLVPTQLAVACFVAVYLKQKTPPPLSVFVKVARGLRTDVIRHTKTALGADQNCAANPPKTRTNTQQTRTPHTNTQQTKTPHTNTQKTKTPNNTKLTHNTLNSLAFVFRGATEEKTV